MRIYFDFYPFKFARVIYEPEFLYHDKCSMWTWVCIFCCYWIKYFIMSIRTSWLVVLFIPTISVLILCLEISYWKRDVTVTKWILLFLLAVCLFLPHVLWCCVVWCIHIKDYDVLLENWSLYHCTVLFFIHDNFLFWSFEVCQPWSQHHYTDELVTIFK